MQVYKLTVVAFSEDRTQINVRYCAGLGDIFSYLNVANCRKHRGLTLVK